MLPPTSAASWWQSWGQNHTFQSINFLLSVPLLYHSMGQIIKSRFFCPSVCLSVCPHTCGRKFYSTLMKFSTEIAGPKSKNSFVRGQNPMTLTTILSGFFSPRNPFPMGRSKYRSNQARVRSIQIYRFRFLN